MNLHWCALHILVAEAILLLWYGMQRAASNTYSVLRFFNCLKEPGCKSLILLNLRSLEHKGKLHFNFLIMYYFACNFNVYSDFCPVVRSHSCRSNLSCSNPKAISLTRDPYKSCIFHLKNNLTFYFRKKNQNTIQY